MLSIFSKVTTTAVDVTMLAETMVPEAFQDSQSFTGLVTVVGFLTAFLLIKVGT